MSIHKCIFFYEKMYLKEIKFKVNIFAYPSAGATAIALGWSKSVQNKTFLYFPSKVATSKRSVSLSIQ